MHSEIQIEGLRPDHLGCGEIRVFITMLYKLQCQGVEYTYDPNRNRILDGHGRKVRRLDRESVDAEMPSGDLIFVELTRACNLMCSYCYLGAAQTNSPVEASNDHKFVSITKKLNELLRGRKEATIAFYGGEPLLEFDLLRRIVEFCDRMMVNEGYRLTYGIVTNGTLLDDRTVSYLIDRHFLVVISLDGDPETMLLNRNVRDVDRIEAAIQIFADRGLHADVLATMQQANAAAFRKNIRYLLHLPIKSVKFIACDSPCASKTLHAAQAKDFCAAYEEIVSELLAEKKFEELRKLSELIAVVRKIDYGKAIASHCGYGSKVLAVSQDGEIYPCPSFLGNTDYRISEGVVKYPPHDLRKCGDCIAHSTCRGSCHYTNYVASACADGGKEAKCIIARRMTKLALQTYLELYIR